MIPFTERRALHRCAGFAKAAERVFAHAGRSLADVAHREIYSCFASAVRIQLRELGIDDDRPLTVTGGMAFAGGPLNHFVFQALVRMAQILPCCYDVGMSEDFDRLRQAYEERVRDLNESIAQRQRELLTLAQVAARVHGAESKQEILDIALDEILSQLGLESAWIFTSDQRERRLRLAASRGVAESYLEEVRRDGLGECLCPEVFWTGHRMEARNTLQCPRMPDIVPGLKAPVAHACVPLKFEDSTKGVLNVAGRPDLTFSEEGLRFLETLGHQVGLAVASSRSPRATCAARVEPGRRTAGSCTASRRPSSPGRSCASAPTAGRPSRCRRPTRAGASPSARSRRHPAPHSFS